MQRESEADERRNLLERITSLDQLFYLYLEMSRGGEWAGVNLTMTQFKVLLFVTGHKDVTMTRLARALDMTLPAATGVVDRLVERGLLSRQADPGDRRVVLLQATEEGSEYMERLLSVGRERLRTVLEYVDLEGLRAVARAVEVVYEACLKASDSNPKDIGSWGGAAKSAN